VTTLTVPARPEGDATLPPVPWRRMAWVTWRQPPARAWPAWAALFGVAAVYLLITGPAVASGLCRRGRLPPGRFSYLPTG